MTNKREYLRQYYIDHREIMLERNAARRAVATPEQVRSAAESRRRHHEGSMLAKRAARRQWALAQGSCPICGYTLSKDADIDALFANRTIEQDHIDPADVPKTKAGRRRSSMSLSLTRYVLDLQRSQWLCGQTTERRCHWKRTLEINR